MTVEGVPEGVDGGSADAPTGTPPVIDESDRTGAEPAADGAAEAAEPDAAAEAAVPDAATETAEPEVAAVPQAGPAAADTPAAPPTRARTPRRTRVRRGLAAAGVTLVVALSVSAFSMAGPTAANADQTFVDTARSQGHVVASGDQETLVVAAAHKICDRRESHSTVAERRATALSLEELGAVQQSFDSDVRGFTALALQTYCPN